MKTYTLYAVETVSTVVEIEAETLEDAIEEFYQQGLPSLMFVDHRYPDESDWEIDVEAAHEDYPEED